VNGSNDVAELGQPFPGECRDGPLNVQEKMMEFLLFDGPNCVIADHTKPQPPCQ
jgi:hypothetical protein